MKNISHLLSMKQDNAKYNKAIDISQTDIHDHLQSPWDVTVIGAGPAGSIAAAAIAEAGFAVLLVDKNRFPREKTCGDGLNHDSVRFLDSIGYLDAVRKHAHEVDKAVVYSTSGIPVEVPGPYYTIRRKKFDTLLANRAVDAGAVFCHGKISGFDLQERGAYLPRVEKADSLIQTRYILFATGADIALCKPFEMHKSTTPDGVAIRGYVESKHKISTLTGSYHKSVLPGYGWIFPMGGDLYNVGIISFYKHGKRVGRSLPERLERFSEKFEPLNTLLANGEWVSEPKGAPVRCGMPDSILPGISNIMVTGEVLGTTFNFTGEGIGKAMETGLLAAEVLIDVLHGKKIDLLSTYEEALDKQFRPKYNGYKAAEKWLANPMLNDLMAKRIQNSTKLHDILIDVIVNEADPSALFR